jgi:hypothetical protein
MSAYNAKNINFTGMLIPCNEAGKLGTNLNLCLISSNDSELLIQDNTAEQSLREYVYERVIVAGFLCEKAGLKYLKVDRFEYLPEEDDYSDGPWDHDEY